MALLYVLALLLLLGLLIAALRVMLHTPPKWSVSELVLVDVPADASAEDDMAALRQRTVRATGIIGEAPSLYLSVVVPAYNEEDRIHLMLDSSVQYCQKRQAEQDGFTWEVVVVDDGSSDRTVEVALRWIIAHGVASQVRVLPLARNVGKGGALRRGMLAARGILLLMADADDATAFSDIEKLEYAMQCICGDKSALPDAGEGGEGARTRATAEYDSDAAGVVVGSRSHLVATDAVAERAWYRNITMYGFHFLVDTLCVKGIRDTQCGFKLFTRKAAHVLFTDLHIERWAFDVELLFLCRRRDIPIAEVNVTWQEVDGSHLSLFGSSVQMAKDLSRIQLLYLIGVWKMEYECS